MSSFPFDGDPADHQDEDLKPVDITDGNGALNPDNGTISNEIKDETPVEKTLTVDGKTYNVGETFKLVGQLQANRWVMNAQFVLNFDASKIFVPSARTPAAWIKSGCDNLIGKTLECVATKDFKRGNFDAKARAFVLVA